MNQNMIQNASETISVARVLLSILQSLGDSDSQTANMVRILLQYVPPDGCLFAGRCEDLASVELH
jgi:hypothetical protein